MERLNNKTNTSRKIKPAVIVSIVIAAVVLLNVGLQFLPDTVKKFDITSSDSYTLSDATKEYLSSVDEEVTIYVLDADGSDIRYEYWLERIGGSFENIDVKWSTFDKVKDKLTALGVTIESASPYLLIIEGEKRSAAVGYTELMSYRTDNSTLVSYIGASEMTATQYNSALTMLAQYAQSSSEYASQYAQMLEMLVYDVEKYFNAEPYLCKLIEYVTVDIIPARYTLMGHGETELSKTEMGYWISEQIGMSYNSLDISGGGEIPEDAVSILVINPTQDISLQEARLLIDFLNRGGQITFFTGEANLDMDNLMSVMRAYGLDAEKGAVGEVVEVKKESEDAEGNKTETTENDYRNDVSVNINTSHKAASALSNMVEQLTPVITRGNSIVYNNKSGFTLTPVLTTSESAYIGENTEELSSRSVAAISERAGGGTLLWFTGAESFSRAILSKEEANDEAIALPLYSNIYVVVASLSLAPTTYESTVTVSDAKYYGERLMSVNETSYVLYTAVIIVLVVALSIFGVIFWYKRKKA